MWLRHKTCLIRTMLPKTWLSLQKFNNRPYAYDFTPPLGVKFFNRITRSSSCQKSASRTSAYKTMVLTARWRQCIRSISSNCFYLFSWLKVSSYFILTFDLKCNTVRAEIFAVVLFSRISRVKPSRKFPLQFMSIYSNDNISKIAKLTPRELPHLAKTAKIMAYTVA